MAINSGINGGGPPAPHAASHEAGGSDEIDATGLAGTGSSDLDIHTAANKGMTASVTSSDGDLACVTAIAANPDLGWAQVFVNGLSYQIGNGTKVGVPCYFSGDGGTTARAVGSLALGDLLYWNGSVSGFQLAASDVIDFVYEAI